MLAAVGVTLMIFGAESIMRLLGESMVAGSPALRLLAIAYAFKSLAMVIGPVLYVVHKQRYGLWYISAAVAIKGLLIAWLGSGLGFAGVAMITLFVEAAIITPITYYYVARFTGFRVALQHPAVFLVCSAMALLVTRQLLPWGTLLGAAAAAGVNVLLLGWLGPFKLADLRLVLRPRA
jgi:O-antigen/teichoic acid export membrane protein